MRYANIDTFDICNGEGIGISLFVQGCPFRCHGCFNYETWDFNGGKEWTQEVEDKFIELASKPFIKRISLLGGECLAKENIDDIYKLVNRIRLLLPQKTIWLYTGYSVNMFEVSNSDHTEISVKPSSNNNYDLIRATIISKCDVVVDGRFEENKKDLSLKFRGSSNQRLIDVKKSLEKGDVVLWDTN